MRRATDRQGALEKLWWALLHLVGAGIGCVFIALAWVIGNVGLIFGGALIYYGYKIGSWEVAAFGVIVMGLLDWRD